MDPYTGMCQCWPTGNDFDQFCTGSRCNLEDLPQAMDDRDK